MEAYKIPQTKLDHICEAGALSRRGACHGEELKPILKEATWILLRVDDQPLQAAAARPPPQGQQRLSLRHVEADVEHLHHPQVEQPSRDDAAVPGTGEAERRAGETPRVQESARGTLGMRPKKFFPTDCDTKVHRAKIVLGNRLLTWNSLW